MGGTSGIGLATAIRFLITNEFVTGNVIECDGGARLT